MTWTCRTDPRGCAACDCRTASPDDTSPNMETLALELDTPYEYPLANKPEDLPDPTGPRYPLVRRPDPEVASLWSLFRHWLRMRRWRKAYAAWVKTGGGT